MPVFSGCCCGDCCINAERGGYVRSAIISSTHQSFCSSDQSPYTSDQSLSQNSSPSHPPPHTSCPTTARPMTTHRPGRHALPPETTVPHSGNPPPTTHALDNKDHPAPAVLESTEP